MATTRRFADASNDVILGSQCPRELVSAAERADSHGDAEWAELLIDLAYAWADERLANQSDAAP